MRVSFSNRMKGLQYWVFGGSTQRRVHVGLLYMLGPTRGYLKGFCSKNPNYGFCVDTLCLDTWTQWRSCKAHDAALKMFLCPHLWASVCVPYRYLDPLGHKS